MPDESLATWGMSSVEMNEFDQLYDSMNMKLVGSPTKSHYFVIFFDGTIRKFVPPSRCRISLKEGANPYTIIFPNHALAFQNIANIAIRIRNCSGILAIRYQAHRRKWCLCVVMNLSPFSTQRKFVVRYWKGGLMDRGTPDFLSKWRLGWHAVECFFGQDIFLPLDDQSFEFVNIVASHPIVQLCHPNSVTDSTDGFLQSSYDGPDFIKGVPLCSLNNPPTILQLGETTLNRKRKRPGRKIGNDPSIFWHQYLVNTCFSLMRQTAKALMIELKGLVAVPFVSRKNSQNISLGYVSIADYRILSSMPRSVDGHNELLAVISVKTLHLCIVDRGKTGNLVVAIPTTGIDESVGNGTITRDYVEGPLFKSCSTETPEQCFRLIKVINLPKVSRPFLCFV